MEILALSQADVNEAFSASAEDIADVQKKFRSPCLGGALHFMFIVNRPTGQVAPTNGDEDRARYPSAWKPRYPYYRSAAACPRRMSIGSSRSR
ncbi:hypothetical protein, partial [Variovorax sp. WDL1]|uniref:hypothetical protein n=1 Tax=Variovorax sp. WDL1 TaxID=207745 RepID=UPI001E5A3520